MRTTRRQFIARSAVGGIGIAAAPLLPLGTAEAVAARAPIVAALSRFRRFSAAGTGKATAWALVDLGESRRIDAVRLRPTAQGQAGGGIALGDIRVVRADEGGLAASLLAEWRGERGTGAPLLAAQFAKTPVMARYLRIEAEGPASTPTIAGIDILSDGGALSVVLTEIADLYCPFPHRSASPDGCSPPADPFA